MTITKNIFNESIDEVFELIITNSPVYSKQILKIENVNTDLTSVRLVLTSLHVDGTFTKLDLIDYIDLDVQDTSSQVVKNEFISKLISNIDKYNLKTQAVYLIKELNCNSFELKVNILIKHGVKYTKFGI